MNKPGTQLRTFARITGIAGILIYLIFLFVSIFPQVLDEAHPNTTADASLLGFLLLGYLFAWFREKEGGIMLMFLSVILGLSYFYQDPSTNLMITLLVCIPLLASGLLFYLYHRQNTRHEGRAE
jgi:hypothetical protein